MRDMSNEDNGSKVVLFSTRLLEKNELFFHKKGQLIETNQFYDFFKDEIERVLNDDIKNAQYDKSEVQTKSFYASKIKTLAIENGFNEEGVPFDVTSIKDKEYLCSIDSDFYSNKESIANDLTSQFITLYEKYQNAKDKSDVYLSIDEIIKIVVDKISRKEGSDSNCNIDCPKNGELNLLECRFSIYPAENNGDEGYYAFGIWPLGKYATEPKVWTTTLLNEIISIAPNCTEVILALHDKDIRAEGTPFDVLDTKEKITIGERTIIKTLCIFQHSTTDPIRQLLEDPINKYLPPKIMFDKVYNICSKLRSMKVSGEKKETSKMYQDKNNSWDKNHEQPKPGQ